MNIEARIAELLAEHPRFPWAPWNDPKYPYHCPTSCGMQFLTGADHAAHVAGVLVRGLGLHQETEQRTDYKPVKGSPYDGHMRPQRKAKTWNRFVTEWVADE